MFLKVYAQEYGFLTGVIKTHINMDNITFSSISNHFMLNVNNNIEGPVKNMLYVRYKLSRN